MKKGTKQQGIQYALKIRIKESINLKIPSENSSRNNRKRKYRGGTNMEKRMGNTVTAESVPLQRE